MSVTAPKCPVCGQVHWPREGHKWGASTPAPRTVLPVMNGGKVALQGQIAVLQCASCGANEAKAALLQQKLDKAQAEIARLRESNAQASESNGFDRKAYQREYMKKRRAAAKA